MSKPKKRSAPEGKLGPHHFAHLRSVAEGLDLIEAAKRFLGVEHGHEAGAAHRRLVDQVRALARRTGDSAWRLIGVLVKPKAGQSGKPSLERFIELKGLDGWSESEVIEMYEAAYPAGAADGIARRERLRKRQLDLLKRLETAEAIAPKTSDLVDDWFDVGTAQRLRSIGLFSLAHIQLAITDGRQWWKDARGLGVGKARRIEQHLLTLIPSAAAEIAMAKRAKPVFQVVTVPALPSSVPGIDLAVSSEARTPSDRSLIISADDDKTALKAWIEAKAGSAQTAKSYEREGRRFLLWLQHERRLQRLAQVTVEDCRAYIAFLQNVPPHWISRQRAAPGEAGWAPFRGPLTAKSVSYAVTVVASWYAFLTRTEYLRVDPWQFVNKDFGDAPDPTTLLDTKAITPEAMDQIRAFIEGMPGTQARERVLFIVDFLAATGLRSTELLTARMKHLQRSDDGAEWLLAVHGKGSKNRIVIVPPAGQKALLRYLDSKGVELDDAPAEMPLLSKLEDVMEPIGYQSLYVMLKAALGRAVDAADLPDKQKAKLRGATGHWLRHTFGTSAVAKEVPLDVVQNQLGHSSITTTMNVYGKAPIKRRIEELAKAFG